MIVTVVYPISNRVRVDHPWPIQIGSRSYFITAHGGYAQSVSVTFRNIPSEYAPTFTPKQSGVAKGTIQVRTPPELLFAEHDIRSWQALLTPYIAIEIDYDARQYEFKPESVEEQQSIHIHNFSSKLDLDPPIGMATFETYARAFLALQLGEPVIELMAFYRDGVRSLNAGRPIEAYNFFFLFIETQFCHGKSGTNQVTKALLNSQTFMAGLRGALTGEKMHRGRRKPRFLADDAQNSDLEAVVRRIVELRGALRHHSLSSPLRWDPNRQEDYRPEAAFLAGVCNDICFAKTVGRIWDEKYGVELMIQAERTKQLSKIKITLDLRVQTIIEHQVFEMDVPQAHFDARLASAVLANALSIVDERAPGAELFAIRATNASNGVELFRYDVGPGVPR